MSKHEELPPDLWSATDLEVAREAARTPGGSSGGVGQ